MSNLENPGAYFKKSAEGAKNMESPPDSLSVPLGNLEFRDAENIDEYPLESSVEGRGLKLSIGYGQEGSDEASALLDRFKIPAEQITPEDQWRILEKFSLQDQSGNEINLDKLIGQNTEDRDEFMTDENVKNRKVSVLFRAENKTPSQEGVSIDQSKTESNKAVIMGSNIASPENIIAFLHEMGHVMAKPPSKATLQRQNYIESLNNRKFLEPEDRINTDEIFKKIADDILLEERDAWAWALNKLRPFIKSGAINKDVLLKTVHQYALKSYSNTLEERFINPNFKIRFSRKLKSFINTTLNTQPRILTSVDKK